MRNLDFKGIITSYKNSTEFIGDYTLQVGEKALTASKIVIATGSRDLVPAVQGLKEIGYLDNATFLGLEEPPKSIIIFGAGLVALAFVNLGPGYEARALRSFRDEDKLS